MIFSIKPARTIQSLVRPHWRNARAVTVNRFTGGAQIRHFVMAITPRMLATTSRSIMRMCSARKRPAEAGLVSAHTVQEE